ncbi:hypothetical protein AYO20_00579 [Fonsecaea nubica]|uniref:Uncharacterized protein n=1 Tax=Fonsecaea nubica TaxID=856822 RepID=A0A178DD89_9EURO|nr:hypothetical protein AYO20_00579 [Fonsecaea nubica]OAL40159.1 hypothetical protein AYO20_00579 [Fonsecaea nubica]
MSTTATATATGTADRDCDCDKNCDTHLHSKMEALGVSCWDFAYPTGKCPLPPVKNCSFASTEAKSAPSPRRARGERRFKHEDLVTSGRAGGAEMVMVAAAAVVSGLGPDDVGDGGQCPWQISTTGTRSRSRSRTQHHHDSHQHHDGTKTHKNGTSKHHHHHHHHHNHQQQPRSTTAELRTYLLSCPTIPSITYPHTHTTISTLLLTPRTQLVLLVPQSNILCPKVCELMRLPRAGGSGICILPVPPEIEMRVVTDADTDTNPDPNTATAAELEFEFESDGKVHLNGASDSAREHISTAMSIIDALAVDEVVAKILKNTPARAFDGYVAFEDERAAWTFLHRVGRGVMDKGVGKGKGGKGKAVVGKGR